MKYRDVYILIDLTNPAGFSALSRFCPEENLKPTDTDVVFFAFAKHLKNPENPIYDQHAIRAMWAICGNLTADEKAKCKKLLLNTKEEWKESGTGSSAVDCYKIYLKHVNEMVK